jgi:DNA polymerase, archaea type
MNELIFGKDTTQRVVSVEPGEGDTCTLFIQELDGSIARKEVPMSHWLLYTEQHSPKMKRLDGNQPYKWIMEYDSADKRDEILKHSRMKHLDLFQIRDPKEAFMVKNGVTMYKGLKVKDVSVLSFDLEHTFGIGDTLNKNGKLLLISNTYRNAFGQIVKELFSYDDYESEDQMLDQWCTWVRMLNPSIIVGHNIFGHDFKILQYAANRAKVSLALGRNKKQLTFDKRKSFKRKDGSQAYEYHNVHCYGREIIDTFFLALTFDVARNYESYGLKQIIKQEGLEKKDRVHYDASKIHEDYLNPVKWKQIKEYAKDDADDALSLFDLMIAPFFYATQSIPRSLQHVINSATGGQINSIMVRGYLQKGHSIAKADEAKPFQGALSYAEPGVHRNVLRFDVSGMYPSIIRQYEIYNKKKDPKGNFLKMMNYFTEERLVNKRLGKQTGDRYYKDLEQSQKILANSHYGFLGAGRVNYNYPDGADQVTEHGRAILKKAIQWATGKELEIKTEVIEDDVA